MVRPKFRVAVVANNIKWPSLAAKLAEVQKFFLPVCDLDFTIEYTKLAPTFASYPQIAPLFEVTYDWYDLNISGPRQIAADIILFVVSPADHSFTSTPIGIMTQNNMGPYEITLFPSGEDDHVYLNGIDHGNSFVHFACHEISHVFYAMLVKRDDTHAHFPANPTDVLSDFQALSSQNFLLGFWAGLLQRALSFLVAKKRLQTIVDGTYSPSGTTQTPITAPNTLLWDTPDNARHSVRVLCDEAGLGTTYVTIDGKQYTRKDRLAACVYQESQFRNLAVNRNRNAEGVVTSTDWGICQINDKFWTGSGRPFKDAADIVNNPEKAVRWMISMEKQGKLGLWVSFSSGAYKKYLPK